MNIEHDWRERVDHADERLDEVDAVIADFITSDPYGTVRQVDGEMPEFTLRMIMTEEKAIPRRVSLLLAEIFGHLRSSLDHLMCALAQANGNLPDAPTGTQFPVFKDRTVFSALDKKGDPKRGSGLWQMRGAASQVQTLIEALQPYHRGTRFMDDPLWLIHDFAIVDKHRKPHLTGAVAEGARMGMGQLWGVDFSVHSMGHVGPFNKGTEVARVDFTVTNPADYMVDMQMDVAYHVAFAPKGPGRGAPVVDTVRPLIAYLRDTVFPQLEVLV